VFIYYRLDYLDKKYKIRKEFEIKIAQMELKALRSQLDPHFIFNALNSIKDYIKKNDMYSSKQYLDDFSYVMRYTLDYSRKTKSLLSDELKFIRTYLNIEAMRFGNRFAFVIEYSDDIYPENIAIPSMMLQTFIENCIAHGKVGSLSYPGLIEIYLSVIDDDRILIKILDNGIGLNLSTSSSTNNLVNGSIHSSQIQFERVEMYNKINRQKIKIQLLPRNDGSPGAELKIELPMLFYMYD
jgi:LytS/YehU family sensor histidine kinase